VNFQAKILKESTALGVTAPEPRRYRQEANRVCRAATCPRGRSATPCRVLRSGTRWQRNLLVTQSIARTGVRCLAHLPIEGYWSAEHKRPLRACSYLVRRLGQLLPDVATPVPTLLVPANLPTKRHLAKLPLDSLQSLARYADAKFVYSGTDVGANTIHCLRHVVSRMTQQIFFQGIAKNLTAGTFSAFGQSFRLFEYAVRDGYRSFHTKSITR
jgi:hypothetical protein